MTDNQNLTDVWRPFNANLGFTAMDSVFEQLGLQPSTGQHQLLEASAAIEAAESSTQPDHVAVAEATNDGPTIDTKSGTNKVVTIKCGRHDEQQPTRRRRSVSIRCERANAVAKAKKRCARVKSLTNDSERRSIACGQTKPALETCTECGKVYSNLKEFIMHILIHIP